MLTSTFQSGDFPAPTTAGVEIPTVSESDHAGVLANIYEDIFNIAIWHRDLSVQLQSEVRTLLTSGKAFEISPVVSRKYCLQELSEALAAFEHTEMLKEDISRLVDLFCQLFERQTVRLRLTTLDRVMCPRFHVDNIPCRLVTTYLGAGTEWLPHHAVDRSKLGTGNNGLPDERSGIYSSAEDIHRLRSGDVAIMKGGRWDGGRQHGLVHRSPSLDPGEVRLLLTLDFIS